MHTWRFLSTLSLRRATTRPLCRRLHSNISIHALLAESDACLPACFVGAPISIHALLAESDQLAARDESIMFVFLSTLSLRRATPSRSAPQMKRRCISIHALLAESDCQGPRRCGISLPNFYPRSPCGERRPDQQHKRHLQDFYPRSPCGERRSAPRRGRSCPYFYPRSPCGERLLHRYTAQGRKVISIHALLAESDPLAFWYSRCSR